MLTPLMEGTVPSWAGWLAGWRGASGGTCEVVHCHNAQW